MLLELESLRDRYRVSIPTPIPIAIWRIGPRDACPKARLNAHSMREAQTKPAGRYGVPPPVSGTLLGIRYEDRRA